MNKQNKSHYKKQMVVKNLFSHIRIYIVRGLLAIVPILLCVFAIRLLYILIDRRIMGFLNNFFEVHKIPGLGILLLLILLYLIGLAVSSIVGHRLLRFVERITQRIPFIKIFYEMGKQLSKGLSIIDGERQAFQKAVLINLNNGLWVPAFVMSSVKSRTTDEELLFVLVPTAPTPASGFVCVVKASQTFDPGWTIEECLKVIVSAGIIIPKEKSIDL